MLKKSILVMLTAGGKIVCRRCKAMSVRTKLQCGRPAINTKEVCQFHGGRSPGPKTEEGRKRIASANTQHGRYSKEAKAKQSKELVVLYQLEDAMNLIGMSKGPKTRGRKPNGYIPVMRLEDIRLILKPKFTVD
jgi:hypothetical protein